MPGGGVTPQTPHWFRIRVLALLLVHKYCPAPGWQQLEHAGVEDCFCGRRPHSEEALLAHRLGPQSQLSA